MKRFQIEVEVDKPNPKENEWYLVTVNALTAEEAETRTEDFTAAHLGIEVSHVWTWDVKEIPYVDEPPKITEDKENKLSVRAF